MEDATRHLLASLVGEGTDPYPQMTRDSKPSPEYTIDWNLFEATEDTDLAHSADQEAVALIAQGLIERLDQLSLENISEDEAEERLEDEECPAEPVAHGIVKHLFLFFVFHATPCRGKHFD